MKSAHRIYLSPPHMEGPELESVKKAFASNWIAPVGPDINELEKDVCRYTGALNAVALSSGTAALHLALQVCGVRSGDDVYCSTFTFAGSAFPIMYLHAIPVFIDSEMNSWNMDPELLRSALKERCRNGRRPGAVIAVHLYGQSANLKEICSVCDEFGVCLIEDAAESMGGYHGDMHTGTIGMIGVFSFNGNKIITTSGGGMLVGKDSKMVERARYLSTQARDPFPYYHHTEIGYNYRMSNILAAIGKGQLASIGKRVKKKRKIYDFYNTRFSGIDGVSLIPRDSYGRGNCWLTCIVIDPDKFVLKPEELRLALENENIESRPLWKPMHLQPAFASSPAYVNYTSEKLFFKGLCLPSGTAMTEADLERVVSIITDFLLK